MTDAAQLDDRNTRARAWFDSLRDRIVAAFEQLEDEAPAELYPGEPGRFELKPWVRAAGGGGVMGFMRGGRPAGGGERCVLPASAGAGR